MIRVSTIIPVYNNATTVARAIDSALGQTFEGEETIVVNDGSNGATSRILEVYARKLKVINQPHQGAGAARNAGLAAAKGEYVAFLDADDEWFPHKLARTVPVLDADPRRVLVFSNLVSIDGEERMVQDSVVPPNYPQSPTFEEVLESGARYISPCAVVMRRSVIELCGGFDESFGRHWATGDSFLFVRARELGSIHYVPERLARIRTSMLIEHLRKRQRGGDSVNTGERLRHYFIPEDRLAALAAKRYGQRASPLFRQAIAQKRWLLLPIAMLAMHDGDRRLARRAYLSLLGHDPLHPETYARLLWTFLPRRVGRRLSQLLPERYQRALMGPPEDKPLRFP
jgi:glycosyltransferase involved in cell wall biosynthesis